MRIPAPRFPVESVVSTAPLRRPARPQWSRPPRARRPRRRRPRRRRRRRRRARRSSRRAPYVRRKTAAVARHERHAIPRRRAIACALAARGARRRLPTSAHRCRRPRRLLLEAADSGALARLATAAAAAAAALEAAGQAPSDSLKPPIAGLPPGWSRIMNFGKCQGYRGPAGRRVQLAAGGVARASGNPGEPRARRGCGGRGGGAGGDGAADEPATPARADDGGGDARGGGGGGLTLVRAENSAGFKGVSHDPKRASKPFHANLRHGGRSNHLGTFATAEEVALAVARFLGPEGAAAAPTPPTGARRGAVKFQRIS